jgi:Protein of unknown function (DUF4089)
MKRKKRLKPSKARSAKSFARLSRKSPARAKSAAKHSGKSRKLKKAKQGQATRPDFIDSLVAASAAALHLPTDPAWLAGIKFNLRLILKHAALVDEFPLPNDADPAPVFHA